MDDVSSREERMRGLVARDASRPFHPPGLGHERALARCPRCSAPLPQASSSTLDATPSAAASAWAMAPFLRDSLATLGGAVGGTVSAVYAFNAVMPRLARRMPKSIALQYAAGVPPTALAASVGAGLGAGVLPSFVQLLMSSFYMTASSANAAVSGLQLRNRDVQAPPRPPQSQEAEVKVAEKDP